MGRSIVFYRTPSGRCSFEEFLDGLSGSEARRVAWLLELVRELDKIPEVYFKKLAGTDGLWEGRVRFGPRSFRVLGFFFGSVFVVTNGFIKKSRKTPRTEIEKAERCRREFIERKRHNGRP
jgi:phage-related protein